MRKILSMLALTSFAGFASAQTIKVLNNTSCTVLFMIHYSNTGNLCDVSSPPPDPITINPGNTLDFDPVTNPPSGITGITNFNGVRVLDRNYTVCTTGLTGYDVGDPCFFPYQQQTFNVMDNSCSTCASIMATYDNSDPNNPIVTFN